jgi:formate hydrogenlyase subunit 4
LLIGLKNKIIFSNRDKQRISILQPLKDIKELFTEENIIPKNAINWLYNISPLIGVTASISILLYLPVAGFYPILYNKGDLILILFLLVYPFLSKALTGFSSGSLTGAISAKKELATMTAYSFPLIIIIISIAWRLSLEGKSYVFSILKISSITIWPLVGPLGFIGFIILIMVFIIIISNNTYIFSSNNKENNLTNSNGYLHQLSCRSKAMFILSDAVINLATATLFIALFFPYSVSKVLNLEGYTAYAFNLVFYIIKIFLVICISSFIARILTSRLKNVQIIYTYWVTLTLLSLVGLICIMWDQTIMINFNLETVFDIIGI